MVVYFILFISIVLLGTLDSRSYINSSKLSGNEEHCQKKRTNIYYHLLIILFLVVGGFRYYVGTDFGAYYKLYDATFSEIITRITGFQEPGIYLLTHVCRMIWDEGIFVIFVENAIITILVFRGLKTYDLSSYSVPLLLYMLYCGWLFSLNGIRQAIAVSIIFAFSKKSEERWILKYFLVVLLASLFHKSAIFMFPILILANRKIDLKQILIILLFAWSIPFAGDYAMDYMGVSNILEEYTIREINSLRIVVSFAPLMLIILLYINNHFDFFKKNCFVTNMVIINAVLTLSTADSAYMNRFSRFTIIYMMVFVPRFTERLTNKSRIVFNFIVILLYFVYFLYEVSNSGNYLPFQWSFGHFGEF